MKSFGLATWLHSIMRFGGPEEVEAYAEKLKRVGYDIVIPCVKQPPGPVQFLTDVAEVSPDYPQWDPLKVLIDACRAQGIKVHAWFCVFREGDRSPLLRAHPDFAADFGEGEQLNWACACRREVQDYVFELYRSLASRYHPDGLHLDYIRTGRPCTCAFCTAQMSRQGVDIGTVRPKDPAHELWHAWRVSRMTGFVRRVHELTQREGMELSAAVSAEYHDWCRFQAQDWVQWAEEGLLEYVFPMTYTNSVRRAALCTAAHVAWVGDRAPVWEGLGKASSLSQLTTEALIEQIRGVIQAGAKGVVLFQEPAVTDEDVRAIQALRSG